MSFSFDGTFMYEAILFVFNFTVLDTIVHYLYSTKFYKWSNQMIWK